MQELRRGCAGAVLTRRHVRMSAGPQGNAGKAEFKPAEFKPAESPQSSSPQNAEFKPAEFKPAELTLLNNT